MSYSVAKPDNFRFNVREKLNHKLHLLDKTIEETTKVKVNKLSVNLEKAVFNYAIKESSQRKIIKKWENPYFVQLYVDRLRTIFSNLSNTEILMQLKTGELLPQTFAFMTHQEMNPDRWTQLIQQKIKRDASKFNTNIEASTDMFTCKKCKSKRCTYYELQTRSADEPATIFVTCLDCGKHWKG